MPRKPVPLFIAPITASVAKEPFNHPDWIFETKLDGYRAITVIDSSGKARLWSRNRLPLELKFPMVLAAVDRLKAALGHPRWLTVSRRTCSQRADKGARRETVLSHQRRAL